MMGSSKSTHKLIPSDLHGPNPNEQPSQCSTVGETEGELVGDENVGENVGETDGRVVVGESDG